MRSSQSPPRACVGSWRPRSARTPTSSNCSMRSASADSTRPPPPHRSSRAAPSAPPPSSSFVQSRRHARDGRLASRAMLLRGLLLALLGLALCAAPGQAYEALSVGGSGACALRADDTVVCWGVSYDGATSAPADRFAAIASGSFNHCGLRLADRSIACWGLYAPWWQPQLPSGPVAAVGIGTFHMCVVIAGDGHVTCVGENDYGQRDAPEGAFEAVAAGWSHTCAIRL